MIELPATVTKTGNSRSVFSLRGSRRSSRCASTAQMASEYGPEAYVFGDAVRRAGQEDQDRVEAHV